MVLMPMQEQAFEEDLRPIEWVQIERDRSGVDSGDQKSVLNYCISVLYMYLQPDKLSEAQNIIITPYTAGSWLFRSGWL